jgi:hypothetical protein
VASKPAEAAEEGGVDRLGTNAETEDAGRMSDEESGDIESCACKAAELDETASASTEEGGGGCRGLAV